MKSKKNKFWSFCFSFIPGCAEMYMGFMKMGLSLMVVFWGMVSVAALLGIGALLFPCIIVWFYSFFHARNLSHMPEGDFLNLEDDYFFHISGFGQQEFHIKQSYRRIMAVVMIVLGFSLCMSTLLDVCAYILPNFLYTLLYRIADLSPRLVVGIGIIFLGLRMIKGKEAQLWEEGDHEENADFVWYSIQQPQGKHWTEGTGEFADRTDPAQGQEMTQQSEEV